MTVRPIPDDDRPRPAAPDAERGTRESAVTPSEQARAGRAEGVCPAAPAVDERRWWEKQLGVELGAPLDAA